LPYLAKKELFQRTKDKAMLVRTPSLDDPAVLERLAGIARTAARNKAPYNMDYYFVGDEGSLTAYTDPVDFCWGPHTLASFRKWLRTQYGSLEAVNREWGSEFREWDAVLPLTTEEARTSGRFAPWADHRTYMEVSFANAYRVVRDAVVEGDPEGRIALSGTQVTSPYNGCDWHRLDQVIDDFLSYSGGNQWDLHRSFAKPDASVGFWTGYGRRGIGVQHEIWSAALERVLHPNLFWGYSVVNPDLTLSKSGRDMGAVFRALRFEGIGALLGQARRETDGVAIHYSMSSVHAASILGHHPSRGDDAPDPGFPANRDGWAKSLSDLGLTYDFVATPQIEAGALDGRRALVLPFSLAVSDAEAEAIRRFAEGGGLVVADAAPGLLGGHCAWRGAGALDDLFGVETPPSRKRDLRGPAVRGPVAVTGEGVAWGLVAAELDGLAAEEGAVRAAAGKALLRVGDADAAIVRRVGRGWAVYLNVLLQRYPEERGKGYGGAAYRALLGRVFGHAGITPPVRVLDAGGRPLGQTRIARYGFGDAEVVAVLREPVDLATLEGVDGVTVFDDSRLGRVARQDVVVELPRAAEVTNARTGEALGRTASVKASLLPGDAFVLGLAPARNALDITGPETAARGAHPAFTITSSVRGPGLLRCHVFAPDGTFRPAYARNVKLEGSAAAFVLPLALNDPAGAWRVNVTDVVTGAAAEARVTVE
jgi:hypothetical protein